eukprot:CFRG2128T1
MDLRRREGEAAQEEKQVDDDRRIDWLARGDLLQRISGVKNTRPVPRLCRLNKANWTLECWSPTSTTVKPDSMVPLMEVREVRRGQNHKNFARERIGAEYDQKANSSFTLLYGKGFKLKAVSLIASAPEDAEKWVRCLNLTLAPKYNHHTSIVERWLGECWRTSVSGSGETSSYALQTNHVSALLMDVPTVKRCMEMHGLPCKKNWVKESVMLSNAVASEHAPILHDPYQVDEIGFARIYKEWVTCSGLSEALQYVSVESFSDWIPFKELQSFLVEVQCEEQARNDNYVWNIILRYGDAHARIRDKAGLSRVQFCTYLKNNTDNGLLDPACTAQHMDMTRPINEYFINSSHNTYLIGDQLQSESSVEAYIRALRAGCRCIEFDCWDGKNGKPVIYHGYTITTKISFEDVVIAVAEHAFDATDYPLIISIENHCSVAQQRFMAETFHKHMSHLLLSDVLDASAEDCTVLPSPEMLKRKILIKNKKINLERRASNAEKQWDRRGSAASSILSLEDLEDVSDAAKQGKLMLYCGDKEADEDKMNQWEEFYFVLTGEALHWVAVPKSNTSHKSHDTYNTYYNNNSNHLYTDTKITSDKVDFGASINKNFGDLLDVSTLASGCDDRLIVSNVVTRTLSTVLSEGVLKDNLCTQTDTKDIDYDNEEIHEFEEHMPQSPSVPPVPITEQVRGNTFIVQKQQEYQQSKLLEQLSTLKTTSKAANRKDRREEISDLYGKSISMDMIDCKSMKPKRIALKSARGVLPLSGCYTEYEMGQSMLFPAVVRINIPNSRLDVKGVGEGCRLHKVGSVPILNTHTPGSESSGGGGAEVNKACRLASMPSLGSPIGISENYLSATSLNSSMTSESAYESDHDFLNIYDYNISNELSAVSIDMNDSRNASSEGEDRVSSGKKCNRSCTNMPTASTITRCAGITAPTHSADNKSHARMNTYKNVSTSGGDHCARKSTPFMSDKMCGSDVNRDAVIIATSNPEELKSWLNAISRVSYRTSNKERKEYKERVTRESVTGIDQALSDLVAYFVPVRFLSFEKSEEVNRCYELTSFPEPRAMAMVKKSPTSFVAYNTRQACRIYPAARRVDSSNFDPNWFWGVGCSMVSMNFQTFDKHLQINNGKFLGNGGCGYILKPPQLRSPGSTFNPLDPETFPGSVRKLYIKVISGQHLKHVTMKSKLGGGITQSKKLKTKGSGGLCVSADLCGLSADRLCLGQSSIQSGGPLSCTFNLDSTVCVLCPELAFLRLSVWTGDMFTEAQLVGQATYPVHALRSGFRCVPLRTAFGEEHGLPSLFLFVHFKDYSIEKSQEIRKRATAESKGRKKSSTSSTVIRDTASELCIAKTQCADSPTSAKGTIRTFGVLDNSLDVDTSSSTENFVQFYHTHKPTENKPSCIKTYTTTPTATLSTDHSSLTEKSIICGDGVGVDARGDGLAEGVYGDMFKGVGGGFQPFSDIKLRRHSLSHRHSQRRSYHVTTQKDKDPLLRALDHAKSKTDHELSFSTQEREDGTCIHTHIKSVNDPNKAITTTCTNVDTNTHQPKCGGSLGRANRSRELLASKYDSVIPSTTEGSITTSSPGTTKSKFFSLANGLMSPLKKNAKKKLTKNKTMPN